MSKTVKGFAVRNQQRRRIRGELSGDYDGLNWFVRCDDTELFWWTIGKLSGFSGPTLADALRSMKRAASTQKKLLAEFGEIDAEKLKVLNFLTKWERRALQGRLEIKGPMGKGDKTYYKVQIKEA
jgi:hypothetical protein